jgi:hypothetical protein
MLERLVRPLVRSQIQLLTQTPSASARLMGLITQWLGYLGIHAQVTQIRTTDGKIHIGIAVNQPDQCNDREWSQILLNLNHSCALHQETGLRYHQMSAPQQTKVAHLLAHVIQAGNPDIQSTWDSLTPRLTTLDPNLLTHIHQSLSQTTPIADLLSHLEPEIAAYVLAKAIGITLLDRQINPAEDTILKTIYGAI